MGRAPSAIPVVSRRPACYTEQPEAFPAACASRSRFTTCSEMALGFSDASWKPENLGAFFFFLMENDTKIMVIIMLC